MFRFCDSLNENMYRVIIQRFKLLKLLIIYYFRWFIAKNQIVWQNMKPT